MLPYRYLPVLLRFYRTAAINAIIAEIEGSEPYKSEPSSSSASDSSSEEINITSFGLIYAAVKGCGLNEAVRD
jgi:hypothetical protein